MLSDPSAERGVLAGICRYGLDAYVDVNDILDTENLTIDSNKFLFNCFKKILEDNPKAKIDEPLVYSIAASLGIKDFISRKTEQEHLRAIMKFPVELSNVRTLAKRVKKLNIAEQIIERMRGAAGELKKTTGDETLNEIIAKAEKPLQDYVAELSLDGANEPEAIDDGIDEYVEYLIKNQDKAIGISSGYPIYDACIGNGFRRGTVNVVGARNKVGKSTWGINAAKHVALNLGYHILNADTEMHKEDHIVKMLAIISGVNIDDIENGKFDQDPHKKKKVLEAKEKIKTFNKRYKRIDVAGKGIDEIISIMRRWVRKSVGYDGAISNNCLIIFDYLKIMDANEMRSANEYQLLGLHMTALHNFAKQANVPILCFSQLNRDGITNTHSGVIAGSDRITWFCSSFCVFKKKSQDEIDEFPKTGNCKLVPLDIRYGPGLDGEKDYINFNFQRKCARITEGKTYSQVQQEGKGFEVCNTIEPN